MRLRTTVFLGVLVALLCVPMAARADDGPITMATALGHPGSVEPVKVSGVRMESEAVQIVVYDTYAECRADFRLVNSGRPRTMRVGFPSVSDYWTVGDGIFPQDLGAFHAWENGRVLPVKALAGHDGRLAARFYEHTLSLPTGATTVTVDYFFRTDQEDSEDDPPAQPEAPLLWRGMGGDFHSVDYILHTGALWAGTIGRAVIRVTFDDSCEHFGEDDFAQDPNVTTPGWTKPDPRTFQWVYRDIEPTQNRKSGRSHYDIRLGYERPTWDPQDAQAQWDNYDGDDDNWAPFSLWRALWRPAYLYDTWWSASDSFRHFSDANRIYLSNDNNPFEYSFGPPWAVRCNWYYYSWFQAVLGGSCPVREIRIVPGAQGKDFYGYSRPKTLVAWFSDGSSQVLHLADKPEMQRFPVDVVTQTVTLRVGSVYRGTKDPKAIAVTLADIGPTPAPRFLSFSDALQLAGAPLPSLVR